jgi:hypothetical protein
MLPLSITVMICSPNGNDDHLLPWLNASLDPV